MKKMLLFFGCQNYCVLKKRPINIQSRNIIFMSFQFLMVTGSASEQIIKHFISFNFLPFHAQIK